MLNNKVLIVYCSRYGTTEEIAMKIASELEELGSQIDLINLKTIEKKFWPNINKYRAIIIGTSIKMGKWTKEIKQYIELNLLNLRNYAFPIGIFIISGLASDPNKHDELREKYIEKPLRNYKLTVSLYEIFAGVLDLTDASKLSWLDKKIVEAMAKEDQNIKINQKNDFRNWQNISHFVQTYYNLI